MEGEELSEDELTLKIEEVKTMCEAMLAAFLQTHEINSKDATDAASYVMSLYELEDMRREGLVTARDCIDESNKLMNTEYMLAFLEKRGIRGCMVHPKTGKIIPIRNDDEVKDLLAKHASQPVENYVEVEVPEDGVVSRKYVHKDDAARLGLKVIKSEPEVKTNTAAGRAAYYNPN